MLRKLKVLLWKVQFKLSHLHLLKVILHTVLILCALLLGVSLYFRTTNLWALKNLGDQFISKAIGRRPIIIGAFHRQKSEQNVDGSFVVIQFIGNVHEVHELYCHSFDDKGDRMVTTSHIQSITKGKRAKNDVCSWGGFLAECQILSSFNTSLLVTTNLLSTSTDDMIKVDIEPPLEFKTKEKLVVCVAPMYMYTEWQIMVTGIETWLALGASTLIFPIQSVSTTTLTILKQYEAKGIVILRNWPKWPVMSDVNPNGLVLSRGIEESHVNCLHFAKSFADMIAFTDIDDLLIPSDPLKIYPTANIDLLEKLFQAHPNAGSLLFEHRDVQLVLPETDPEPNTLENFNFQFLHKTEWKQNCRVWRMKTRVVVKASRVDAINMHEASIHRLGYAQVRVPCREAHFYHLRHSYRTVGVDQWRVNMTLLANTLNTNWDQRLQEVFAPMSNQTLAKPAIEPLQEFDQCVMRITEEHFKLKVSRCMTPHVCYSRSLRDMSCKANSANYEFLHNNGDFIIVLRDSQLVDSDYNCEAPIPRYIRGNYFYLP